LPAEHQGCRVGLSTWPGSTTVCRRAGRARASTRRVAAASPGYPATGLQKDDAGARWSPDQGSRRGGGDGYCVVGSFENLDHGHLRQLLDLRVRDGVIRRTIGKWLNAGVQQDGSLRRKGKGTPQGGVISPLLANIYLHHVLDHWYVNEVKPRLRGRSFLVRYADDVVIVCEREDDAHRLMAVLPKRLGRFGLQLHPDKTHQVPFGRPRWRAKGKGRDDDQGGPGTFDFLGFTHQWARSRKGNWVVKQNTSKSRFNRAVKATADWCRRHRHLPVPDQHKILSHKLRGHFNYFGITGNSEALGRFRTAVGRLWRKWLDRRSQRRHMPWPRFERLLRKYPLPPPIAVHSLYRLAAKP